MTLNLKCLLLTCCALVAIPAPAHAAPSPYSDARIARWAQEFLAGHAEQVAAEVESDLLSAQPHPLAPTVWLAVALHRFGQGHLRAHLPADATLRARLEPIAETYELREHGDLSAELAIPRSVTPALDDPMCAKLGPANVASAIKVQFAIDAVERWPWTMAGAIMMRDWLRNQPDLGLVELTNLCKPSTPQARSATCAYLKVVARHHTLLPADELTAVEAFLRVWPTDVAAAWRRADLLNDLGRHAESAGAYLAAHKAFPFRSWVVAAAATQLVNAQQADEAARLIEANYLFLDPDQEVKGQLRARLANAFLSAGQRAAARQVLDQAQKQGLKGTKLEEVWRDLELADTGRAAHAVTHAERVLAARPRSHTALSQLLVAYQAAGEPGKTLAAFEVARAAGRPLSEAAWYNAELALIALKRTKDRVGHLQAAVKNWPESSWMQRRLAQAHAATGDYTLGVTMLQKTLLREPDNAWAIAQLAAWSAQLASKAPDKGQAAATSALRLHLGRFPWALNAWEELAKQPAQAVLSAAKRTALLREAHSASGGAQVAADAVTYELLKGDQWHEACDFMAAHRERARANGAAALADALDSEMFYWGSRSREKAVELAETATLEAAYVASRSLVNEGTWYRRQIDLMAATKRKLPAVRLLREWLRSHTVPTDIDGFVRNSLRVETQEERWGYLQRWLDADPFNAEHLVSVADLHIRWGGSPIVGLWLLHRAEALGKTDPARAAQALSQLGDTRRHIQNYLSEDSIATSLRYLSWYDNARHQASEATTSVGLPFDKKTHGLCPVARFKANVTPGSETWAVICHKNGLAVVVEHDPQTGKPLLLQHGAAYVRARYDAQGQLIAVKGSSGAKADLGYDATGNIISLRTGDSTLRFQYTDARCPGKPTRQETGAGVVDVLYDAACEVQHVDSHGARNASLEVTRAFQKLIELIRPFSAGNTQFPELPFVDAKLDRLQAAVEKLEDKPRTNSAYALELARGNLQLARHLVANVDDAIDSADRAARRLAALFRIAHGKKEPAWRTLGVEVVHEYHTLLGKVRLAGATTAEVELWSNMQLWLAGLADAAAQATLAAMRAEPVHPNHASLWLPESSVANKGLWQRHLSEVELPVALTGAKVQAMLVRKNGDVILGTDRGLAVQHRGWWQWYGFDVKRGQWQVGLRLTPPGGSVLALAETDGALWLGTPDGLQRLAGAYDGDMQRWRSEAEGLPVPRVEALASLAGNVWLATTAGMRVVLCKDKTRCAVQMPAPPFAELAAMHVHEIVDVSGIAPESPRLLLAEDKLVALDEGGVHAVVDKPVAGATWDPEQGEVVFWVAQGLYRVPWLAGRGATGPATKLPGQEAIAASKVWHGLALVPIDATARQPAALPAPRAPDDTESDDDRDDDRDNESITRNEWPDSVDPARGHALAVLTDKGMSLYRHRHFEPYELEHCDRKPGVVRAISHLGRAWFDTTCGLYSFDIGLTEVSRVGEVADILYHPGLAMTLVAAKEGLYVLPARIGAKLEKLDDIDATRLAPAGEDAFLTTDGTKILRYERDKKHPKVLFDARPTSREAPKSYNRVTGLLQAKDGAVWAVCGASAWRWRDDHAQEFSMLLDPQRMPVRTNWLANVIETRDGRLLVIGSKEGHLEHHGVWMTGGVVEWTGKDFKRVEDMTPWFITSYTPIDSRNAWLGTASGMAREHEGRIEAMADAHDPSFDSVLRDHPALFLATRGTRAGSDIWLFGTPSGVLAHKGGEWFWPERLNWLIPTDVLPDYGGRAVHGIAADKVGHLVIGTDAGVLVYDGEGDPTSLLVHNRSEREAFSDQAVRQVQAEAGALLDHLAPDSPIGRRLEQVRQARARVQELEAATAETQRAARTAENKSADGDADEPLRKARQAHAAVLLKLEREEPALHQMLQLQPIDLSSMHAQLPAGDVVVQYLPTAEQLIIQVATRAGVRLHRVDNVKRDKLFRDVRIVVAELGARQGLRRGGHPNRLGHDQGDPITHLHDLYEILLAPVAADLAGSRHVWIVPPGTLSYLPFGALVVEAGPKVRFAVEEWSLGTVTSLYALQALLNMDDVPGNGALVIGDPDGSLPGARAEAIQVSGHLSGSVLHIGDEASFDRVAHDAADASILHFATHGVLDGERPERSYLLLGKNERIGPADIASFRLRKTRLAVLSACESGIGGTGLEYATIARAFLLAGVPTVVATLWQVNDAASASLMVEFYTQLQKNQDRLLALTMAQRWFLEVDPRARSRPSLWAGFVLFGKP